MNAAMTCRGWYIFVYCFARLYCSSPPSPRLQILASSSFKCVLPIYDQSASPDVQFGPECMALGPHRYVYSACFWVLPCYQTTGGTCIIDSIYHILAVSGKPMEVMKGRQNVRGRVNTDAQLARASKVMATSSE